MKFSVALICLLAISGLAIAASERKLECEDNDQEVCTHQRVVTRFRNDIHHLRHEITVHHRQVQVHVHKVTYYKRLIRTEAHVIQRLRAQYQHEVELGHSEENSCKAIEHQLESHETNIRTFRVSLERHRVAIHRIHVRIQSLRSAVSHHQRRYAYWSHISHASAHTRSTLQHRLHSLVDARRRYKLAIRAHLRAIKQLKAHVHHESHQISVTTHEEHNAAHQQQHSAAKSRGHAHAIATLNAELHQHEQVVNRYQTKIQSIHRNLVHSIHARIQITHQLRRYKLSVQGHHTTVVRLRHQLHTIESQIQTEEHELHEHEAKIRHETQVIHKIEHQIHVEEQQIEHEIVTIHRIKRKIRVQKTHHVEHHEDNQIQVQSNNLVTLSTKCDTFAQKLQKTKEGLAEGEERLRLFGSEIRQKRQARERAIAEYKRKVALKIAKMEQEHQTATRTEQNAYRLRNRHLGWYNGQIHHWTHSITVCRRQLHNLQHFVSRLKAKVAADRQRRAAEEQAARAREAEEEKQAHHVATHHTQTVVSEESGCQ